MLEVDTHLSWLILSDFRNEALQFLCIYIDPTIPATTDTADAQQFLVLRNAVTTGPDADVSLRMIC